MVIETERLKLIFLNPIQLGLWIEYISVSEKELHCSYEAEPMEGFFLDIVKKQLKVTANDSKNYLWHSFCCLLRKSDNIVVGSAHVKNIPNDKGEVEIGYGLGKEFEHHGYLTEAVSGMCIWALEQDIVLSVIAEMEIDGYASQRILERCGFKKYRQDETIWWRP